MRTFFILLMLFCWQSIAVSQPLYGPSPSDGEPQTKSRSQSTDEHQKTEQPEKTLIENVAPVGVASEKRGDIRSHADDEAQWYAKPDWWIAGFTAGLMIVTAGLWLATWSLWKATAKAVSDGEKSVKAASAAAVAATAHVGQAERSAKAMERVADSMAANVEIVRGVADANREMADRQAKLLVRQMRPYLSVAISQAVYQDASVPLKFEAKPLLINTGNTPAYNVRWSIKADVLPIPLRESMNFEVPKPSGKGNVIASHSNGLMSAIVDKIFFNEEIADIKSGKGRSLVSWGRVEYSDIFGEEYFTEFCHLIFWRPDDSVYGFHQPQHGEANWNDNY